MAAELKKEAPDPGEATFYARRAWNFAVRAVARSFYSDNSGFDTYRFLRATGFTDEELERYPHRP